jgi:hypothetical protein
MCIVSRLEIKFVDEAVSSCHMQLHMILINKIKAYVYSQNKLRTTLIHTDQLILLFTWATMTQTLTI